MEAQTPDETIHGLGADALRQRRQRPLNRRLRMKANWARLLIGFLIALLVLAIAVRWLFWEQLLYVLGGGIFAEP